MQQSNYPTHFISPPGDIKQHFTSSRFQLEVSLSSAQQENRVKDILHFPRADPVHLQQNHSHSVVTDDNSSGEQTLRLTRVFTFSLSAHTIAGVCFMASLQVMGATPITSCAATTSSLCVFRSLSWNKILDLFVLSLKFVTQQFFQQE